MGFFSRSRPATKVPEVRLDILSGLRTFRPVCLRCATAGSSAVAVVVAVSITITITIVTMADRLDMTPLPSVDEKKTAAADVSNSQIAPIPTDTFNEIGRFGALKGWLLPRHEQTAWAKFLRFLTFLGPGAIISVAYIDPDNYQVAISSGGSFQYKLLFMVLVSNIIAIYLQVCVVLAQSVLSKSIVAFCLFTPPAVVICEARYRDGNGSCSDEPSLPPALARALHLCPSRGVHHLH